MKLITGEYFQSMADIYIGTERLLRFNPFHLSSRNKWMDIQHIHAPFNNPPVVFCYPDILYLFAGVLRWFINPFTLITHNSDICIERTDVVEYIANFPGVKVWFAVNVCFSHPKIRPLPIGIANSQWNHGNLAMFDRLLSGLGDGVVKTKEIYMNFTVTTAPHMREQCKSVMMEKGVEWLETVEPEENNRRLSTYKYCICPEGNGPDTHRLWECFYVRTVPISLKTAFSIKIKDTFDLPMILVDSWGELDVGNLPEYAGFNFDCGWMEEGYFKELMVK
jgi:hypothetical protein